MSGTDRSAAYRIEHRDAENRTVIRAGTEALAPLAARLAAQGRGGHLAVVRQADGHVLIRFPIDPAGAAGE